MICDVTLTALSVVRLEILQQLLLLHDFILGLVQLDPAGTTALSLLFSTDEMRIRFTSLSTKALTQDSNLHVCIQFPLQV